MSSAMVGSGLLTHSAEAAQPSTLPRLVMVDYSDHGSTLCRKQAMFVYMVYIERHHFFLFHNFRNPSESGTRIINHGKR